MLTCCGVLYSFRYNSTAIIAAANRPEIRLFTVAKQGSMEPLQDLLNTTANEGTKPGHPSRTESERETHTRARARTHTYACTRTHVRVHAVAPFVGADVRSLLMTSRSRNEGSPVWQPTTPGIVASFSGICYLTALELQRLHHAGDSGKRSLSTPPPPSSASRPKAKPSQAKPSTAAVLAAARGRWAGVRARPNQRTVRCTGVDRQRSAMTHRLLHHTMTHQAPCTG